MNELASVALLTLVPGEEAASGHVWPRASVALGAGTLLGELKTESLGSGAGVATSIASVATSGGSA